MDNSISTITFPDELGAPKISLPRILIKYAPTCSR